MNCLPPKESWTEFCQKWADIYKLNVPSQRESWDEFFLSLAQFYARRSKDPSTKVGAVIVRPDNTVAGLGYNGFPRGMPDEPELYKNRDEKYSRIVHGEINAKDNCRDPSLVGYTLYTWPFASCDRCFVQMANCGIKRFVSPKPSEEVLARWGASLEKTKKYAQEMKVEIVEL